MAQKLVTSFGTFSERKCTMALVLDKRTNRKNTAAYPLSARFTIDRKPYYYHVGGNFTPKEFSEISNAQKSKSPKYATKLIWQSYIDKYKDMLESLNRGKELTLDSIRIVVEGKSTTEETSFLKVWEGLIHRLQTENGGERATTADIYRNALNSFKRILWDTKIVGFKISKEELIKWNNGMKNGVLNADGVLVGKIADATRGIYLRHARAVWNECTKQGYLLNVEYPFSNVAQKGLIVIPKGPSKKDSYLDVQKMTRLYQAFINHEYHESWDEEYKKRVHHSLGMFLVQYLCNGFNLMDAAHLTYSQFYFDMERRAFKFHRHKTRNSAQTEREVVVPIIEPLQRILDEVAAEPSKGSHVFPYILQGETNEAKVRKLVSQENSNIADRVRNLCANVLKWEVSPSNTWVRHSFATNLSHAGIKESYLKECMGHSEGQNVTEGYIGRTPLDKMFEYNNALLDLNHAKPKQLENVTAKDIKKMSKKEMAALLAKLVEE